MILKPLGEDEGSCLDLNSSLWKFYGFADTIEWILVSISSPQNRTHKYYTARKEHWALSKYAVNVSIP